MQAEEKELRRSEVSLRKENNLERLFNPESIAMVGASAAVGKWGCTILFNILNGGFAGKVFPVNPREKSIMGLRCYPSVGDIPEPIDVAMITTPAQTVPTVIDECGAKGIPFAIVVTSNFSETGAEGARLERIIVEKARGYGMRIIGPNTMGIFSAASSLHALMPTNQPLQGRVSMLSQSGNIGQQMLCAGLAEGVGFEKVVSSGNEADLTCGDYLRYLGEDEATKVILAYLEGVKPDADFLPLAKRICMQKPVVVLKGGRTDAGEKAAASHTGALGGSANIYRGIFRQAGIVEVTSSQRLIDCAKGFSTCPIPRGKRVAILTRGGGLGVLAADACEENGLIVPPLSQSLIKEIDKLLPAYWSHGNPIDMVAVNDMGPFLKIMDELARWDGCDAIITTSALAKQNITITRKSRVPDEYKKDIAGQLNPAKNQSDIKDFVRHLISVTGKPVIDVDVTIAAGEETTSGYQLISLPTAERAVHVISSLVQYGEFLKSSREQLGGNL